jgi:hypothetical protein
MARYSNTTILLSLKDELRGHLHDDARIQGTGDLTEIARREEGLVRFKLRMVSRKPRRNRNESDTLDI